VIGKLHFAADERGWTRIKIISRIRVDPRESAAEKLQLAR